MTTIDTSSDADTAIIFRGLRELKASFGPKPNKEELAITMISACIYAGLNTRTRIVRALKRIELNGDHVAIVLNRGTGGSPARHRWLRDGDGVYSHHPETLPEISSAEPALVVNSEA